MPSPVELQLYISSAVDCTSGSVRYQRLCPSGLVLYITCTIRQHFCLYIYYPDVYIQMPPNNPVLYTSTYACIYLIMYLCIVCYISFIIIQDYDIYTQIILNLDVMVMVLYEWRGGGSFSDSCEKRVSHFHTGSLEYRKAGQGFGFQ